MSILADVVLPTFARGFFLNGLPADDAERQHLPADGVGTLRESIGARRPACIAQLRAQLLCFVDARQAQMPAVTSGHGQALALSSALLGAVTKPRREATMPTIPAWGTRSSIITPGSIDSPNDAADKLQSSALASTRAPLGEQECTGDAGEPVTQVILVFLAPRHGSASGRGRRRDPGNGLRT